MYRNARQLLADPTARRLCWHAAWDGRSESKAACRLASRRIVREAISILLEREARREALVEAFRAANKRPGRVAWINRFWGRHGKGWSVPDFS